MSRISLMQLRPILLQNVTMMIFVVIKILMLLFQVFFEGEAGGGGGGLDGKSAHAQHQRETERSLLNKL